MFNNIKNRFISAIAPDLPPLPSNERDYQRSGGGGGGHRNNHMQDKFQYARPHFLQLITPDELKASADHNVRPIIVPRDINMLPWGTGYAECVNSGKSEWNEDQAAYCRQVLCDPEHKHPDLPYTYFGVFDGHAGYGAALAASHQFHHILHEKLVDCIELLLPRENDNVNVRINNSFPHPIHFHRRVTKDELIIGALESSFFHMDSLIAQDRDRYRDAGGCTACVSLFIDGKMYVANAGDSRAVLCQRKTATHLQSGGGDKTFGDDVTGDNIGNTFPVPFSADHTPETERERLLNVARLKPYLLGKQYVAMEYAKRPHNKDMGQRILCRQGTMKGWTFKTLTREDLRMPVVTGEGKRSRLLGTLGVTRGFGDHDLLAINTGIQIKPFLTPHPDVKQRDLTQVVSIPDEQNDDGDYGVLIMATDGLWDVSENDAVARTVFQTLSKFPAERHRYTMVAQELVAKARGKVNDSGHWRLADSKAAATVDDISVIVIPVQQYYKEHVEWTRHCHERQRNKALQQEATEAKEALDIIDEAVMNGIAAATAVTVGDEEALVEEEIEQKQTNADDDNEEEEVVIELNSTITTKTINDNRSSNVAIEAQETPVKATAAALQDIKLQDDATAAGPLQMTPDADAINNAKSRNTQQQQQQQHQHQQKSRNQRKSKH